MNMARKKSLKWFDWLIILIFLVLAAVPDPTDVFDFGFPFVDLLLAFSYWYIRVRGLKI